MTPAELLVVLGRRGVRVRPDGDSIKLAPRARLTPGLINRVREFKPALLDLLRDPEQMLKLTLIRIEGLADGQREDVRAHLGDLLAEFGPEIAVCFLKRDADAVRDCLERLEHKALEAAKRCRLGV